MGKLCRVKTLSKRQTKPMKNKRTTMLFALNGKSHFISCMWLKSLSTTYICVQTKILRDKMKKTKQIQINEFYVELTAIKGYHHFRPKITACWNMKFCCIHI